MEDKINFDKEMLNRLYEISWNLEILLFNENDKYEKIGHRGKVCNLSIDKEVSMLISSIENDLKKINKERGILWHKII